MLSMVAFITAEIAKLEALLPQDARTAKPLPAAPFPTLDPAGHAAADSSSNGSSHAAAATTATAAPPAPPAATPAAATPAAAETAAAATAPTPAAPQGPTLTFSADAA